MRALAAWCNGFVSGLGLGGLRIEGGRAAGGAEIQEVLRDLVEIGKADFDVEAETDLESAEASFAEIVEFVRVGVQIVFEEIGRRPQAPSGAAIH